MYRRPAFSVALAILALLVPVCAPTPSPAKDQPKPPPPTAGDRLSSQERLLLIRGLQSEFVYVRRTLPISKTGAIVKNGQVTPSEQQIMQVAAERGLAAKPGAQAKV